MKRIISSILTAAAVLIPASAFASPVIDADVLTGRSIADDYVAGKLDARLIDLGTNKSNGVYTPAWRKQQEDGVRLHCSRTYQAKGIKNYAALCKLEASKYVNGK